MPDLDSRRDRALIALLLAVLAGPGTVLAYLIVAGVSI
jgi:hypothetical protein